VAAAARTGVSAGTDSAAESEVGEHREVQVGVAVAERPHFELLENLDTRSGDPQRVGTTTSVQASADPASEVQFRHRARGI
jgi:hypothetical protein